MGRIAIFLFLFIEEQTKPQGHAQKQPLRADVCKYPRPEVGKIKFLKTPPKII